jgi:hypothetical protein
MDYLNDYLLDDNISIALPTRDQVTIQAKKNKKSGTLLYTDNYKYTGSITPFNKRRGDGEL